MKVLHVYKDFFPPVAGGIERHVALMCRFQRPVVEVEALVCSRRILGRMRVVDGIRVREVGEWGRVQGAPLSPAFPIRLHAAEVDVAVIQTPNPTAEISVLLARPNRVVVRYQSDVIRQDRAMKLYRPFFERYLNRADAIVASSTQYVDSSPYLKTRRSRCTVIPIGIAPESFSAPADDHVDELRESYGGQFVFACGRHVYYKGLEYLVEAASRLPCPAVIAGTGPLTGALAARAAQLGADVRFAGTLSDEDLRDHLHACSVFAFPSVERSEAFGMAMLEAQACAKPVVATTLGTGVEHVNLDGVTGFNVPPRNPEALAAAINLLLRNKGLATELGAAARERVHREFDARDVARRELELYRSVL